MGREQDEVSGKPPLVWQSAWAIGVVFTTALLGNVCVVVGAVLAMLLEVGASRTVGVAVNWAAFAFMVVLYCAAVVLIMRTLVATVSVPFAVWPALGVFPIAWGVLVISSPGGPYQFTPVIVTGVGAIAAWLMVGRNPHRIHANTGT